jgi:ABC-type nitrate/sulfonate/bicarbonate transport system ATPase subunit
VIPPTGALTLSNVSHVFGTGPQAVTALSDISIEVASGEFVSIIGRSGCGKTTLFNIVAGLLTPSRGRVLLDGENVTGRAGLVAYMLQKDLLLPWRTVIENVVLGLELAGVPKRQSWPKALPLLQRYGLEGFENSFPGSLSGGMRQRAALLRTLLCERDVILLDEPFGALDAQTRISMQEWLLGLWKDFERTVVLVTHDVDEAIFMSDRVYVLSPRPGRVKQVIEIVLPRPRVRSITTTPEFSRLKEQCMQLLFDDDQVPQSLN